MIGGNGGASLIGVVLVAALIAFFHEGAKSERSLFAIEKAAAAERSKIDQLVLLLRKYPNAQVGASDDAHYPDSWYRPLAIFDGAPLAIDFVPWMDFAFAGKTPDAIAWSVSGCTIPVRILPAGEAFSISNWYTATRLLPTSFRDTFYANYRLIDSSATYSVCLALRFTLTRPRRRTQPVAPRRKYWGRTKCPAQAPRRAALASFSSGKYCRSRP